MVFTFTKKKMVNGKQVVRMVPTSVARMVKRFNYYNDAIKSIEEIIEHREVEMIKQGRKMSPKTRADFIKLNEEDRRKVQLYIKKATKSYELALIAQHQ